MGSKMRFEIKLPVFIIACFIFGQSLFAQGFFPDDESKPKSSFIEFKFGTMRPEDTEQGNLLGFSTGRRLDDRLYWGFEFNHFKSSFQKETTVAEFDSGGINFRDKQLELDFTTRIVSIFLQISYELRLDKKSPIYLRASGGGGLELIWNNENNFLNNVERTRFFNAFGWQLTGGIGIRISKSGIIFFDGLYNSAVATKKLEPQNGLPTFREIDISGVGFRVGVNVFGVGL